MKDKKQLGLLLKLMASVSLTFAVLIAILTLLLIYIGTQI